MSGGVSAVLNAAAEILTVDRISKRLFNGPSRAAAETGLQNPKAGGYFGKRGSDFPSRPWPEGLSAFSSDLPAHVSVSLLDVNGSSLHVGKS